MLDRLLEITTRVSEQKGVMKSIWTLVNSLPAHARVALERAPTGAPTVILIHGIGISSRYMIPTAVRLAPFCRVYAPDLPGFGKSAKPDHVLNLSELTDALSYWMDSVGVGRAILLGNSFGCQIVVDFALRYPDRIQRAVLVGPTIDPKRRTAFKQILTLLRDSPREPRSQGLITFIDYLNCGLRRLVRTFQYALQDRIEDKLPHVQVPTLVVRGALDPIVPQRWAEEATRLLPKGRLVVIPGAAHTVNYNSPLELVRVVRPFLEEGSDKVLSKREISAATLRIKKG